MQTLFSTENSLLNNKNINIFNMLDYSNGRKGAHSCVELNFIVINHILYIFFSAKFAFLSGQSVRLDGRERGGGSSDVTLGTK